MKEYMTDDELLNLINDIEEHDIVQAPPRLSKEIIYKIEKKNKIIEYKRFRNRVITSVAAILIVTISAPCSTNYISENIENLSHYENVLNYKNTKDKLMDTTQNQMFINFEESHYISDLLNRKED